MSLLQETKNIQSKMAMFCRNGKSVELPGVTPNRFHHYRRLIFNILQENLESAFPITHEYIAKEKWQDMLNDFFSHHDCQSYQVSRIPGEFYEYAVKKNLGEKFQLLFLNDLLKFEWEELRLYNMEDKVYPLYKNEGDNLKDFLVFNPEHIILQLEYPIHLEPPTKAIDYKGNYFVLLYREKDSGKIQFVDISVWFALVIEQLSIGKITLMDLLGSIANLLDEKEFINSTIEFIIDLRRKQFILGFK